MRQLLKAHPHLKVLDRYEQAIAKRLFDVYPQWAGYARVGTWHGEIRMEVEITSPMSEATRNLLIVVDNEITIHFYECHLHIGRPSLRTGRPELLSLDEQITQAKEVIDELLSERLVSARWLKDGNPSGYGFAYTAKFEELWPDKICWSRSWLGTFDRGTTSQCGALIEPDRDPDRRERISRRQGNKGS